MDEKARVIRTAAIIAIIGNSILAALKIITGAISNSSALTSDGVDSLADVLTSAVAFFIVRVISKPADNEHPWGHGRAETVATALLSFTIFFTGAQLALNAAMKLISGERAAAPENAAIIVAIISIAGKILLAQSQYILGKRANSAMLKANGKNMTGDVATSAGVLIGLVISMVTDAAYADTVIAMLIGVWIIKNAVGIFIETNLELMDGSSDMQPYRVIVEAVDAVEGAFNPHRARMRRIAGYWDIDLDIGVDSDKTVSQAHDIATRVEDEIKSRLENVFDIMVHIEPRGDDDDDEGYGLSEDEMRGAMDF